MTAVPLTVEPVGARGRRLVRADDVLWRRIPGFALMLLRAADDVVVLSATGLALWDELAEPRDLDEVATALAASYGITPDEVMTGLDTVLGDLSRRGFVVVDHDD